MGQCLATVPTATVLPVVPVTSVLPVASDVDPVASIEEIDPSINPADYSRLLQEQAARGLMNSGQTTQLQTVAITQSVIVPTIAGMASMSTVCPMTQAEDAEEPVMCRASNNPIDWMTSAEVDYSGCSNVYVTKDVPADPNGTRTVFGSKLYHNVKPISTLGRTNLALNDRNGADQLQFRSPDRKRVDLVANDVVGHQGSTIQLVTERTIQVLNPTGLGKRYISEYALAQLVSLSNDGVLGLGLDGNVYQQKSNQTTGSLWQWKLAPWAPRGVVTMVTTHNNDYLWLQTATQGYLYHTLQDPDQYRDPVQVEKVTMSDGSLRVFGNSRTDYIDYNPMIGSGLVYPGKRPITEAYRALLCSEGYVIIAPPSIKRLRWVNGVVYHVMDRS
jgi:hypothetical protein